MAFHSQIDFIGHATDFRKCRAAVVLGVWTLRLLCCRRTTSVSTLMYVKEDLIIPHHISFYDLISTKARGKSGPLFHFDVHEDIRTQHDARLEKDESHAGTSTNALG